MRAEGAVESGEIAVTDGVGDLLYRQRRVFQKPARVLDAKLYLIAVRRDAVLLFEYTDDVVLGIAEPTRKLGEGERLGIACLQLVADKSRHVRGFVMARIGRP